VTISETHSTSSLLRELYEDHLPHLFTIRTDYQTAGRGQAGNSWESERGKNLLFSTLLRYPEIDAA
jgi:BirA family biotin operon repressor/biotin-[acetyl-CoA-carboxylase] ligase